MTFFQKLQLCFVITATAFLTVACQGDSDQPAVTTIYEYRGETLPVTVTGQSFSNSMEKLSETLGKDGWRLVSAVADSGNLRLCFQRRVDSP